MKRTSKQIIALLETMGQEEVALALSSHKWRTKAYNDIALKWLADVRSGKRTGRPLEAPESPEQEEPAPTVAETPEKPAEERTERSSPKEKSNPRTKTKPKGAK